MIPTYDAYVDDMTEGTPNAPDKYREPTPEAGDNYLNMGVMLPHSDTLSRGQVIELRFDANGNPIGRAIYNSILNNALVWLSLKIMK